MASPFYAQALLRYCTVYGDVMCAGQVALEEYDFDMDTTLKNLTIDERIRIVEDLWDSIARDQGALPLTQDQVDELDRRLDSFEIDGNLGRPAKDVIFDIRKRL
jgi:putative addiction module component (TIGR02574 family)